MAGTGDVVSTVFTPDPTCVAASNLWLSTAACNRNPYQGEPDATCTYAFHGETSQPYRSADNCFATLSYSQGTAEYTACPESYTSAAAWKSYAYGGPFSYTREDTYCCPTAYSYKMDWLPFSTDFHGTTAWVTANTHHPYCKATSVEVLRSQVITVTLAREPEVVTTTTQLADDATLFAEAAMFRATVYSELGGSSTCWGKSCPYTWTPTYTYPSTITPTPTLHYTPPASCVDPDNLWVVTTSCYLTAPTQIFRGGGNQTPDWLACTPTMVGAPGWYLRAPCSMPLSTVQEADTLYYSGCPSGYTAISTGSSQGWYDTSRYNSGWYDITAHNSFCCPTAYSFTTGPTNEGQSTTTVHDGMTYGLFVYPLPRCYATSVDALSGKEVPMHTTSDTMAWDKRQEGDAWPTTVSWDYARGTVWAQAQYAGYTVLMGTHTCYESCSTWLDYYYPDRTGGATPATATTVQPSSTSTSDASSEGPADSTTTSSGANGTSPTQIETSGAVVGMETRLYHIAGFLFFILVFLNS